jgi:hypothetical protein
MAILIALILLLTHQSGVGQVCTEGGEALPGVEICVKGSRICTASNSSGQFELRGFGVADRLELTAAIPGFYSGEYAVFVCSSQATAVILLLGIPRGSDCTYAGAPDSGTRRMKGAIVSSGAPLSDALVTVRDSARKVIWTGHSIRNVRFTSTDLPEGTYTLEVNKSGYQAQQVTIDLNHCNEEGNLRIRLSKACQ